MSDSGVDDVDSVRNFAPELRREFCDLDFWTETILRGLAYACNSRARLRTEQESDDIVRRAVELILDGAYVPTEGVASIDFVLAVIKKLVAAEPEERGLVHPRTATIRPAAARLATPTAA